MRRLPGQGRLRRDPRPDGTAGVFRRNWWRIATSFHKIPPPRPLKLSVTRLTWLKEEVAENLRS